MKGTVSVSLPGRTIISPAMNKNHQAGASFTGGGFAEEIFEDMLYDEYALNLPKNAGLGIGKMLYEELSRNRF